MKTLRKIINYLRPAVEGEDGKFSYKRISQVIFLNLISVLALRGVASLLNFYVFLTVSILFLLVAAIISIPQLILLVKYFKGSTSNFKEDIESTDTKSEDESKPLS